MNQARSPRARLAQVIATAGGIGYAPVAPGTFGTAATIPLAFAGAGLPAPWFFAAAVAVCVVGIWACSVVERETDTHDASHLVIDEVAGYLLTMCWVDRSSWIWLLCGFVVFRVLDIWKPFPIRLLDEKVAGGLGVMVDDILAGLVGGGLLYGASLIDWSRLLP